MTSLSFWVYRKLLPSGFELLKGHLHHQPHPQTPEVTFVMPYGHIFCRRISSKICLGVTSKKFTAELKEATSITEVLNLYLGKRGKVGIFRVETEQPKKLPENQKVGKHLYKVPFCDGLFFGGAKSYNFRVGRLRVIPPRMLQVNRPPRIPRSKPCFP